MNIQCCLIRKNTKELIGKLKSMGYRILNTSDTTLDAHNYDGRGSHRKIEEGRAIITSYNKYFGVIYEIDSVALKGRIDCGTNEDLFLALAALSDDTDYMQYFIAPEHPKPLLCKHESIEEATSFYELYRKMSQQELIEHFKAK